MASVIVFGPTGQTGSVAALTAAEHGSTVWLAMRDTTKDIPGLSRDKEQSSGFQRVQADLLDPESVSQAIKTSDAKRAFIYLVHGASDHLRGAIEALKSAGVEFIVFLSSFTIETDKPLRDIASTEILPYIHAQIEANLDDVFGEDHYVAVRPGCFASNLLSEREGVVAGNVSLPFGGVFQQDNIVPGDIGRVCGTVLASGPRNGQKKVYLYGPGILSLHDCYVEIGKVLSKEVKVTALDPDESWKKFSSALPEIYAKYMMQVFSTQGPDKGHGERFPHYDEGVKNVELYTGKPSTSFVDWVKVKREELSG